jgi:hypothetical protein
MPTPESIEREERKRVIRMAEEGRRNRGVIKGSTAKPSKRQVREGSRKMLECAITLRGGVLTVSNAIAAGDLIRSMIVHREEFESKQSTPIIHVKDGKPLTAHGARLLGVPWPQKP